MQTTITKIIFRMLPQFWHVYLQYQRLFDIRIAKSCPHTFRILSALLEFVPAINDMGQVYPCSQALPTESWVGTGNEATAFPYCK